MKPLPLYFGWLQRGNPTGSTERLPELTSTNETSMPGIYCIGDLTGIPLIKLAAESGHEVIEQLARDRRFQAERKDSSDPQTHDLIIVGAGPAGVAAGLRAKELGYTFVILESSRIYNTIVNFPTGKPIHITPEETPVRSALRFRDGTKETLLEELRGTVEKRDLPVRQGEMVDTIVKESRGFSVKSAKDTYRALRVIVAIGKSGNARMLGVPGEELPKVFTRLIDPADHSGQDVLVVGGGDSAIEAAVALAQAGARVSLSYRKTGLSRPKEENVAAFQRLVSEKKIASFFESTVSEIGESDVVLKTRSGEEVLKNDAVFGLIGSEIPIRFFKRSGVRMAGERRIGDHVQLAAAVLFAAVLYFGKKAPVTRAGSIGEFFSVPGALWGQAWPSVVEGFGAWIAFIGMILCALYILTDFIVHSRQYFTSAWRSFKYFYYAAMFCLFGYLYTRYNFGGKPLLGYTTGTWYTAMYSLTIVVFGLRRIHVKRTGYVTRQTLSLMAFQVIPLFILPVFVLPWMGSQGLLGTWVMDNVFPGHSYWRAYGFVLAWPLFVHNLASGQPIVFWLIVSLVQTFAIIPWLNYKWGKGAYCGWICSCGGLAETLGDEYRTKAPHGPRAKRMDNWGQVVLWFAAVITVLVVLKTWFGIPVPARKPLWDVYAVLVDIVFAGVLGVGVYFAFSGRVWCRFLCPLAALMHIYTRFSKYRIMGNKKRCISCNICTKVCHMGIDVMGYANRGIPMDDVECVRCSSCISSCPMQAITFGDVGRPDPDNLAYKRGYIPLQSGWQSGLARKDIGKLLDEEKREHPGNIR